MDYFFVRRPTVAIVLSIILIIFGVVALRDLPVSQYPEVVPPEIQVNSTYTGADAIAVEQSVTTPLEQKINGVRARNIQNTRAKPSPLILQGFGGEFEVKNIRVKE